MSVILPYPALHKDSLDYDDPEAYAPSLDRVDKTEFRILHKLNTGNLVANLVAQGSALFFSTVSVGGTIFRKTEVLPANAVAISGGKLQGLQEISIPGFIKAMNVFVRPGIVLEQPQQIDAKDAAGVSDFHKQAGSIMQFPEYSIIAYTNWLRCFSMHSLFIIASDKALQDGVFRPELLFETMLKIKIYMSPRLFDEVEGNKKGKTRAHVLCSSLTQALETLQAIYAKRSENEAGLFPDGDEDDYPILEMAEGLKEYIEQQELKSWEAGDDFNAAYVASQLYPATLPDEEGAGS